MSIKDMHLSGILHFLWKDFDLDDVSKNHMGFSLSMIITIPFGV